MLTTVLPPQLCSLLVEREQQRGVRVTTEEDATSSDISSSSEVVSPRLLSFNSVKELQTLNQTLMGQLRGLEEERDRQTVQITSSRYAVNQLTSSLLTSSHPHC